MSIIDCEGSNWPITAEESAASGFTSGVQPGENYLDTKQENQYDVQRIGLTRVKAHGFTRGHVGNIAAFNLKEHVSVTVTDCEVYDNEIAYRVRGETSKGGPAIVRIVGGEIRDNELGIRYEDNIADNCVIQSTNFANNVKDFRKTSATDGLIIVKDSTFDGPLPVEAPASQGNTTSAV